MLGEVVWSDPISINTMIGKPRDISDTILQLDGIESRGFEGFTHIL